MAMKLEIKNIPSSVKIIGALLPSIVIPIVVFILMISPKLKEIKTLDAKIDQQNNEIASDQAKVAKLPLLIVENEKLLKRLNELKEYIPEEKEISNLLKQISDLCAEAGMQMLSWRPGGRSTHSSGIVYVTPVSITVRSSYHTLGIFLSSLTTLNRIVNVDNISFSGPNISFTAYAFSAIPEVEGGKK